MGIPTGPAVFPHVGTPPHSGQDRSQSCTPAPSPVSVPLSVRSETNPKNPRSDTIENQGSEYTRDTNSWTIFTFSRGLQTILPHGQDVQGRICQLLQRRRTHLVSLKGSTFWLVSRKRKSLSWTSQDGAWTKHTSGQMKRNSCSSTSVKDNLTWCGSLFLHKGCPDLSLPMPARLHHTAAACTPMVFLGFHSKAKEPQTLSPSTQRYSWCLHSQHDSEKHGARVDNF